MFDKGFIEDLKKRFNKIDGDFKDFFISHYFKGVFHKNLEETNSFEEESLGSALRILKDNRWIFKFKKGLKPQNHLNFLEKFIQKKEENCTADFKNLFPSSEITPLKRFFFIDKILQEYKDENIENFEVVAVESLSKNFVINGEGIENYQEKRHILVHIKAKDKMGFIGAETLFLPEEKFKDLKEMVKSTVIETLNIIRVKKEGKKVVTGEVPVVFSSKAAGFILNETIGIILESDTYEKTGKNLPIGEDFNNEKITVTEEGPIQGFSIYDDEGYLPKKRVLVDRGKVVSLLSDYKRGRDFSLKEMGNGRREEYSSKVCVGFYNFNLKSGDFDEEEMIEEIPFGLYIKRFDGGRINIKKESFTFPILEGYIIRDGKIGEPLRKGVVLKGDVKGFLQKIKKIGRIAKTYWGLRTKSNSFYYVSESVPPIFVENVLIQDV